MWISVKDALPKLDKDKDISKMVLFTDGVYVYAGIREYSPNSQIRWTEPFLGAIKNVTHWQPLPQIPQGEQQIETEIDIKQGISEQSKKWGDMCNAYNQERINKLAEEIKAKQEELRGCDEISNIVSSGYKAL